MYKEAFRPAWAEINLTNFDHNIKNIIKKVGLNKKIIGVIKADAYGHGSIECAQVLRENGVKTFAIATLAEAIKLRESGTTEDIIVLGLTPDMYADIIVEYNLIPTLCSYDNAKSFSDEAEKSGKSVNALIAVDTGMGRIGYLPEDTDFAIDDIKKIGSLTNLNIAGLMSHMATADASDKTFSHYQEDQYNAFYKTLVDAGIDIPFRTLANSASIMELPTAHFDGVRPGIILYGCYPSDEVDVEELDIKPVMSIKANIIHLKEVPCGFSVGYGRKYISKTSSKIATISLGYADGYPRPYSQYAKVIINGVFAPVAGNICMDQFMIDVSDVPNVKLGDEVIIMGTDGKNTILADDIAKATGTINYEITCAFGQRLPKVYVK